MLKITTIVFHTSMIMDGTPILQQTVLFFCCEREQIYSFRKPSPGAKTGHGWHLGISATRLDVIDVKKGQPALRLVEEQ